MLLQFHFFYSLNWSITAETSFYVFDSIYLSIFFSLGIEISCSNNICFWKISRKIYSSIWAGIHGKRNFKLGLNWGNERLIMSQNFWLGSRAGVSKSWILVQTAVNIVRNAMVGMLAATSIVNGNVFFDGGILWKTLCFLTERSSAQRFHGDVSLKCEKCWLWQHKSQTV